MNDTPPYRPAEDMAEVRAQMQAEQDKAVAEYRRKITEAYLLDCDSDSRQWIIDVDGTQIE